MMRVLYLLNYAGKAGTERYVESLVKYLGGSRVEPYFAYNIGGLLVERLQALGVETIQLPMKSRFDLAAAKKLARICEERDIDLIHTHYLREHYTALLSKSFNPKPASVYTSHFVMENDAITRFSNRLLSKRQDRIIAVCNIGREQLIKNGLDADKIEVVFNAVDPGVWSKRGRSTLRSELGIDDDRFIMLCASRFADDKGHDYLLRSAARLRELTDRPFVLVLAGDGELQGDAKALAAKLGLFGCVRFVGFREDIKNLYDGSDVYVNSSRHEALSFLIIEAMAAGLPVIATDMGGNSDIVNDETGCGLLVKYDDTESMASAMKRMLEDAAFRQACARRAVETVDDRFNIFKMAERTYGVYEAAVENNRGGMKK